MVKSLAHPPAGIGSLFLSIIDYLKMKTFKRASVSLGLATAAASLPEVRAIECSKESLQSALPAIATVDFATWMPENSTFKVPAGDIAYPTSPTQLKAACVVQISVKNGTSDYGFGVFLPDEWNGRFL